MPTFVTISRKWNRPEISITVDNAGIELRMELADFISALKEELGSVAFVIKKSTLAGRIDVAVDSIISSVKAESSKVIGRGSK